MTTTYRPVPGVPSTAAIAGHPIHPMLVPFPIAFLVGTLLTDLCYWWTGTPFWAQMSLWLVGAGFISGGAAAIFGLIDFLTIGRVRAYRDSWIHLVGNAAVLGLALLSLVMRLFAPVDAVLPGGIILSGLITGLLLITGWYGGELAYRHRIGVTASEGELTSEVHPMS